MTDFKIGDRVKATRDGRGFEVREGDLGTVISTTVKAIEIVMDNPRGRPPAMWSTAHYVLDPDHASRLFEHVTVTVSGASDETMIPASKVREIAEAYAKRHGWCEVVDKALEEMGVPKPEPEMVEVTFTQTRVVRLREEDLDSLKSVEDLDARVAAVYRLRAMFEDDEIPSGAELVSSTWKRSETRKLSDIGWTGFGGHGRPGGNPAPGKRVRVRLDRTATSLYNVEVAGGTEGRVMPSSRLDVGFVLVDFERDGMKGLVMRAEDMQAHPR